MRKVALIAFGTLLASVFSTPALGIDLTLDGGSDFQIDNGPTGSVGSTSYNSGLNQNTGHQGFDSFFTSQDGNFGRLGTDINSTQSSYTSGIYRNYSVPFHFSSSALLNPTQTIKFDYAFDGTAGIGVDSLSAYLALSSAAALPLAGTTPLALGYTDPGGTRNANMLISSSLLNNLSSYVVTFELNEVLDAGISVNGVVNAGITQDSAAGFDNIRISNATPVPFDFSPGMGILALGAWGATAQLKSKVQKWKTSNRVFEQKVH